ncbi:ABC transporter permease [Streptomyces sp. NBC_00659]|uniref:ABC transporter permease n=1 Tax=Streptomyces sp. NBC_00659 TaxID=2903669 RepID=UPI002E32502A|nr:ABC transporter permease [Streptomyces sp. NBC_00659]
MSGTAVTTGTGTAGTTAAGRIRALARAELTLLGRTRATLAAALFVPLIMPFTLRSTLDTMRLKDAGLTVGSVLLPSSIGFVLLFAVYGSLASVYTARREELVLKRLRTGELRDLEILAGAALPSVAIGIAQCLVLTVACRAAFGVGMPEKPQLVLLGLLSAFVTWPALAAVTASFSRSVEGAQVAATPLTLLSLAGSGTFIPLELLPDGMARFCELLPLTPVITLIRGGWTGHLSAHDTLGALATAVAWTLIAVFAVRRWFRWEPRR